MKTGKTIKAALLWPATKVGMNGMDVALFASFKFLGCWTQSKALVRKVVRHELYGHK